MMETMLFKLEDVLNAQLLDEGGGIRRSELDKLFNYMYSTAPRPPSPDAADTTPLVSIVVHWLVEQGLTSHSTQFRPFRRRRFYRSDDPTNSVKALKEGG